MRGAQQRRQRMPIVRVSMFSGRTHAQKQELARAITEAVANIAHTTPDATIVIFEDIERENWAEAGKLASDDE
ncbi:MAG TPA: tautomerase family protein [Dehalococcoidia bacterium]|nr:tautomerase family protein [Dehalococcoidia bacterium]